MGEAISSPRIKGEARSGLSPECEAMPGPRLERAMLGLDLSSRARLGLD